MSDPRNEATEILTPEEMDELLEVLADPIETDYSEEYEPTAEDLADMEEWLDSRSDINDFLERN